MTKLTAPPLAEAIYATYVLALRHENDGVADHLLCALELLALQSGDNTHLDSAYALIERSANTKHSLRLRERTSIR
ncbi:hypothetical protein [Cupriavidus oxalaticus]|uniref:Uncharacterized protein n=1 Tax=Cupriavidus oxalaticus TaxID=96344 RepID=A0A375FPL7_9BURK|nr:hypothetical protein [Cupriavidus oxalaticus]QRQ85926.1 hypothetical protein JTE91_22050 [Cupriavidus oxalaticus]QRQ95748.1 hypothetical protein JTE92_20210 [Cupriavidus oxalaticus]WQD84415.1 hypothetical protein U0036_07925 [Cupriavidus oxalaticus]SPC06693.1 hypothetical protein CO2235_U600136 [Cupriavidus oxalaticus]SPC12323.1 hypothetical protein CO2235_140124 [Cupriavidus oxalaticus]